MKRFAAMVLIVAGCSISACSTMEPTDVYLTAADLPSASVQPNGSWQTSSWTQDTWVDYPGLATLHIDHTLGYTPTVVMVYLSFEPNGLSAGLAAGDLARVKGATDTTVTIQNGTKGEYYARVVLY